MLPSDERGRGGRPAGKQLGLNAVCVFEPRPSRYTTEMLFEWSAECAADDPVLVIPWSDPANPASHFVDLREDAYAVDEISEAERYPPILQALRALNAPRSPVFTAKCDAWTIDPPDELEALRGELDLAPEDARTGVASYIDLLWRDRTIFASFHQHEHLVHRIARRIAPADHTFATVECVIRPALLDLAGAQQGYALTLYVKALGREEEDARAHWGSALDSTVAIFRSKDLTPTT